jgi:hypothetical protein
VRLIEYACAPDAFPCTPTSPVSASSEPDFSAPMRLTIAVRFVA